jgi:hypothetical protein
MILALLVLVPISVLMVWAFFHFSPKLDNQRRIIYFNLAVLILGFLVCGGLTLKVYENMSAGTDRAWWPIISELYSLAVFPVVLFVGGLVRNLLLFRSRDPK